MRLVAATYERITPPNLALAGLNWAYVLAGAADATPLPYVPLYVSQRGFGAQQIVAILAAAAGGSLLAGMGWAYLADHSIRPERAVAGASVAAAAVVLLFPLAGGVFPVAVLTVALFVARGPFTLLAPITLQRLRGAKPHPVRAHPAPDERRLGRVGRHFGRRVPGFWAPDAAFLLRGDGRRLRAVGVACAASRSGAASASRRNRHQAPSSAARCDDRVSRRVPSSGRVVRGRPELRGLADQCPRRWRSPDRGGRRLSGADRDSDHGIDPPVDAPDEPPLAIRDRVRGLRNGVSCLGPGFRSACPCAAEARHRGRVCVDVRRGGVGCGSADARAHACDRPGPRQGGHVRPRPGCRFVRRRSDLRRGCTTRDVHRGGGRRRGRGPHCHVGDSRTPTPPESG